MRRLVAIACSALLLAACDVVAPDTPTPSLPTPTPTLAPIGPGLQAELAPIISVATRFEGAQRTEVFADIESALPNGCTKFHGYEVSRTDRTIRITVINAVPSDRNVVCTQVYSTHAGSATLGRDFERGQTYKLIVNGNASEFQLQ